MAVDLTPGVTVIMIGLIVCICALVLVLLLFFVGRRPLIEGCLGDENMDDMYRCVGAQYVSEVEIREAVNIQRERKLVETLEYLNTRPVLPMSEPISRPQVPQAPIYLPPPRLVPPPPPPPLIDNSPVFNEFEDRRVVRHSWYCDVDSEDDYELHRR